MQLSRIIQNCECRIAPNEADIQVSFITNDSRKAAPSCLFVAVKGRGQDARVYIPEAVEAGAIAVMYERPEDKDGKLIIENIPEGVVRIEVENSRKALALAAANFYEHPSSKLELVGVTGTNGKTTIATLLYEMFSGLGYNCGLMSTIANFVAGRRIETQNTTSDPLVINALLAEMLKAGCKYCFMEVSSIGIEQHRIDGLEFKVGIFTNLTHDHLDYHGSFAEYLDCKRRFFDSLPATALAISNMDDRNGLIMTQNSKAKIVGYSCRILSDYNCHIVEQSLEGMLLDIDGSQVWTLLIGVHNASNIAAIYATALSLGIEKETALLAISKLRTVKGRLETMTGPKGLRVVIDYAHTPDALENVLKTLKEVAPERSLFCLFGCGGDRDRSKRAEMGEVAAKYADRIILTSDNSRSESTEDIIADIKQGISQEDLNKTLCISNRKEAIRTAIMLALPLEKSGNCNVTILLAGKGHETYQLTGNEQKAFDERKIVEEIFKNLN